MNVGKNLSQIPAPLTSEKFRLTAILHFPRHILALGGPLAEELTKGRLLASHDGQLEELINWCFGVGQAFPYRIRCAHIQLTAGGETSLVLVSTSLAIYFFKILACR